MNLGRGNADGAVQAKGSLRVKILTWNMGDAKLTQDEWQKELIRSWEIISKRDFDILGICLQEDSAGSYGKFGQTVEAALADAYVSVSNAVIGPPTVGKIGSFAVKAFLFIKKARNIQYDIAKADTCLSRTVFCTKSTVGISLVTRKDASNAGFQFILMSAHLPVDTSQDDFGYSERIKAVDKSFRRVYEKLVDQGVQQRVSVFAGDFNFRDNTPITERGVPVRDQLAYAMSDISGDKRTFRSFVEADVTKFPPTYKLRTSVDGVVPKCRETSDSNYDPSCYIQQTGKTRRRGFFGKKREVIEEPSHTDRILYRGDNIQFKLLSYKSWGRDDAISASSHNLVYADFDIIG